MFELRQVLTSEEDPFESVVWSKSDITTKTLDGGTLYSCKDAEFPDTWSDESRQIVASKYFRESRTDTKKETSLRAMITRVVSAITTHGVKQKYFLTDKEAAIFTKELTYILLHQLATFNSPVWFNVGVSGVEKPQVSACFINTVDDSMESIMDLAKIEGLIFKEGSGSGVNLSNIRASKETLSGGGSPSGPVSFMQGFDAFANVILSGGRLRRAARMVILDIDHPDIIEFINCKVREEHIVEVLADGGITSEWTDPNGGYSIVKHQSGNHSVRVTDTFMRHAQEITQKYREDADLNLTTRVTKETIGVLSVKDTLHALAKAAHACGDPGIQFKDTINAANTCASDGDIEASNPCSEFLFLGNSACNLASINLVNFLDSELEFSTSKFKHVVNVMILAQDILVEMGHYPTQEIESNSHNYRPLGLGYANLGGLLMHLALPYDSNEGRDIAASITSLMTSQAYLMSSYLAERKGAFKHYERNAVHVENVIDQHYAATRNANKDILNIAGTAVKVWQDVLGLGIGRRKSVEKGTGFRNAQVTLLAPTGTTGFMMGVSTTGIEPDMSLQKTKVMVGGGILTYVNPSISEALHKLGYSNESTQTLIEYINEHGHLENSILATEHLPIFDCALTVPGQTRQISVNGHIDMVAAVQPFLSGAVSKTFNMSNESTVTDVERVFLRAWERKLKCIAIYRHGSKMSEPLRMRELKQKEAIRQVPQRIKPPENLVSLRHEFHIGTHHGYFHVGLDPETKEPLEIFIRVARFGSTVGGLLDSYATLFSKALQYGLPLEELISHMEGAKFPPAGITRNPEIQVAQSIIDYIARWIKLKFLNGEVNVDIATYADVDKDELMPSIIPQLDEDIIDLSEDTCPTCGHPMVRTGTCTTCRNCSYNSGVCG